MMQANHSHLCHTCGWWRHTDDFCEEPQELDCPVHQQEEEGPYPQSCGPEPPAEEAELVDLGKVIYVSEWMQEQIERLQAENAELRRDS